jgi:hypothetical protein
VKGPWDGYAAGTWVHHKNTTTMQIPGVEMPPQVQETKQTLVQVTEEAWVVRTEVKMGESWMTGGEFPWPRKAPAVRTPDQPAPKVEELGSAPVTIEGKEYAAKKVRTTGTYPGGAGTVTTTTWASEEHGVLRSETESPGGLSSVMETLSLSKKVKVGDKEVVGRETKTVSRMPGGETTMVAITSDAVPGLAVRAETTASIGGQKTVTLSELVGFEAK